MHIENWVTVTTEMSAGGHDYTEGETVSLGERHAAESCCPERSTPCSSSLHTLVAGFLLDELQRLGGGLLGHPVIPRASPIPRGPRRRAELARSVEGNDRKMYAVSHFAPIGTTICVPFCGTI